MPRLAMLVLQAITGPDGGDPSSVPSRFDFDAAAPVAGLRIGYVAQWLKDRPATDVDRAAMETVKTLGMELREVALPDWPYSSLMPILFAEGAAAFEAAFALVACSAPSSPGGLTQPASGIAIKKESAKQIILFRIDYTSRAWYEGSSIELDAGFRPGESYKNYDNLSCRSLFAEPIPHK